MNINIETITGLLQRGIRIYRRWNENSQRGTKISSAPSHPTASGQSRHSSPSPKETGNYPGDYRGRVDFLYCPNIDGDPDPGEIVWTWVPYEEDYSRGKDRPVILVGRDGTYLLGLMLTSKDRNNTERRNNNYLDIGTGTWDKEGRPSEVKLNRVIRVKATDMRREGAILDRDTFATIERAFRTRRNR